MHTKRSDESQMFGERRGRDATRLWAVLPLVVATLATFDAHAQTTLTINGAGGVAPSGSDGVKTEMMVSTSPAEQSYLAGNWNWCCAPMPSGRIISLLVGSSLVPFNSVTLVATTGSASTSAPASGSGSATLRYVGTRDGRTYQIDRRIDYRFPNAFVRETYTFSIPEGNTEPVRFYYGGDAAPGASDQGYGILLTSPVRTIISLNPTSGVQLYFREVRGGRPFDGASAAPLGTGFGASSSGADLGFVAQPSLHDAELFMQWNLGSLPGTFVGAFENGSGPQEIALEAAFADETLAADAESALDISLVNTRLEAGSNLGFALALPAGLTISGSATSSCGGTLTAAEGSSSVTLAGATVAAASNCVVSVPIEATAPGTYTLDGAVVTSVTGVVNGVATATIEFVVPSGPDAPTDVVVTPSPETLSIAFTAPDPGDEPITAYEYSLDGGTTWNATTATASPIVVTGLTNGTTYQVAVRAVSAAGNGAASTTVPGTPADVPAAPTSLVATGGDGTLSVAFVVTDDGGSAVTDIEYAVDGGTFVSSGAATSPVVIAGLTNGTTYAVVLRAVNATGTSADSAAVTGMPVAAPAAPTLVAVNGGDRRLVVSYTLNSNNGSAVTDVEYSVDDGVTFASAGLANPFTIRRLTNDQNYQVRVRAVNAIGTSAASAMLPGTPVAPGTLMVKASPEPAGDHCTHGGVKIEFGNDNDDSGALDDSEVTQTQYACNGAPGDDGLNGNDGAPGINGNDGATGATGATGAAGKDALVTTRAATAEECATGGTVVVTGIDDDANGALDVAEVDSSAAVCNGADGFVDSDTDGVDDRVELVGGTNCNSSGAEPSVALLVAGLTLALRRRRRA